MFAVSDTGDWRSRKWASTHRRIFDTAMRLFQEQGFDRVNVGQLAAAAEVSVPTFYAHFPSKEHIVMQLPTAEQMAALLATQPADLPVGERLAGGRPGVFFAQWTPRGPGGHARPLEGHRRDTVAAQPRRRVRADDRRAWWPAPCRPEPGGSLQPAEAVVVDAHLAAFTRGLLAWADSDGQEDLQKLVDEAISALHQGGAV